MSRKFTFTALAVAFGLVASACGEQTAPTAESDAGFTGVASTANLGRVVHHVSVGGPDICEAFELPTGCDANFSLTANEYADGSVRGQMEDVRGRARPLHFTIDCLHVVDNQAWVSGFLTLPAAFAGLPAISTVVDNGRSKNDPVDQISFVFLGDPTLCTVAPNAQLFDYEKGQVTVR